MPHRARRFSSRHAQGVEPKIESCKNRKARNAPAWPVSYTQNRGCPTFFFLRDFELYEQLNGIRNLFLRLLWIETIQPWT